MHNPCFWSLYQSLSSWHRYQWFLCLSQTLSFWPLTVQLWITRTHPSNGSASAQTGTLWLTLSLVGQEHTWAPQSGNCHCRKRDPTSTTYPSFLLYLERHFLGCKPQQVFHWGCPIWHRACTRVCKDCRGSLTAEPRLGLCLGSVRFYWGLRDHASL